ncbi:MAG: hypothetical protein P8Y48_11220, partial [Novosphingobium sp.]
MPIRRPLAPTRIALTATAALALLTACSGASGQNDAEAPPPHHTAAAAAMPPAPSPDAAPIASADCDPGA